MSDDKTPDDRSRIDSPPDSISSIFHNSDHAADRSSNMDARDEANRIIRLATSARVDAQHIINHLRDYWEGLRNGRAIPERADIEPRGIGPALDYAFVLERIAPGAARFRLAGRHLVDLMGMEVRGMPLCSLFQSPSRGRLSDVLETVFKGPQIAEFDLHGSADYARPELNGRMLLLPLRSDLGDITRALGCFVTGGEVGRGPRRFDIRRDTCFPVIRGAKLIDPSPSGFAEDMAPWRPPRRADPETQRSDDSSDHATSAESGEQPSTPEARRARFRVISTVD